MWEETHSADIVHLHDFAYFGNWSAFVCATLRHKPVFITQHVGFIPYRSLILRIVLRMVHATIGRVMLGSAGQVVFVSSVVQEYYARFVHFRRPPGIGQLCGHRDVRPGVAATSHAAARLVLALTPGLLFVVRFVEKKGLHTSKRRPRMPDVCGSFPAGGRQPRVGTRRMSTSSTTGAARSCPLIAAACCAPSVVKACARPA